MATPVVASGRRVAVRCGLGVAYTVFLALFCNLILELLQTGGNVSRLVSHSLGEAGALTMLNTGVIWVIVLLVWAVTGRLAWTTYVVLVVALVIGYANYLKLTLRLEPLYPSDVDFASSPGFLTQMAGIPTVVGMLVFILALGVVVVVVSRVLNRRLPRIVRATRPRLWWSVVVSRVLVAALTVTFLAYAAHFNDADNRLRATYEATGAHWAFWFQRLNYFSNGFVGGVLYNLEVPAMEEPTGYSAAAMNSIVDRYVSRAHRMNVKHRPTADDPNIVLILSEAFSDPTRIDGVKYAEDPIPKTRELMRRTNSGTMLAQLYGGGTANMEFETLTGMSLSQFEPQLNTPYQMLVPDYSSFPSVVGYLKDRGYAAAAVHPYMTSMYKRAAAYPVLGFDQFVGEDDMQEAHRLEDSDFISDESAFSEAEHQLYSTDEPTLVNLVTMQNHVPMGGFYEHPLPITGLSGDAEDEAENYGRGLQYTDDALADFLGRLEKSGEKTAVIFYGDHLAGIWPTDIHDRNGSRRMRETPYFAWANFDLLHEPNRPLTSPIYFMPNLFRMMGADLPPYYALLLDLQEEIPAMEQGEYFDESGELIAENDLNPRARRLLADYRMVQYDLSIGKRYSEESIFYPSDP